MMEIRTRLATLAWCALAGSVLPFAASQPARAADGPSVAVSYQDLDLSRPADARVLYQRLQRAAQSVCSEPASYELARHAAWERCVAVTLKDAVARVNSSELVRTADEMSRSSAGDAQTRR
jgi:UrcA family protein